MDPWALEVTRLGRTRRLPWRNIACALPGLIFRGEVVHLFLNRTGMAETRRFSVVLHYGYGHKAESLADLINDARAEAVPDEPHPYPKEKRRRIERVLLIGMPLLIAGLAILFYALGVIP